MASFLLDENISPVVARQIAQKNPDARIASIHSWHNGELLSVEDEIILQVALQEKLTLVTFDLSTIQPLLKTWAEDGRSHAGVIFIDDKSIANNNYGMLVKAMLQVWERLKDVDFTDGVLFLKPVQA
jgi:hypothetical protein